MSGAAPMPSVKCWADDLRAAFGAAEMQEALKSQGYYASEGGRVIDTRKYTQCLLVTPVLPMPKKDSVRGR